MKQEVFKSIRRQYYNHFNSKGSQMLLGREENGTAYVHSLYNQATKDQIIRYSCKDFKLKYH